MIYRIRNGIYNENKHKLNDRDINKIVHFNKYYKTIIFCCGDAKTIIDNNINNDKSFMFLDPPFLLTGSFYTAKSTNIEYCFNILMTINEFKSTILAVCGNNVLLIPFYEKYNINILFKTTINYRGNSKNKHENIYVSNYKEQ